MKGWFVLLIWVLLIDGVFDDDEMKTSVSVMEGDSLTLHTAVTGLQNDKSNFIKWYFNNIRVARINGDLSEFCTDVKCPGGYKERFRDRLKLNNQTGSLTIMNIRITDSGDYLLLTINNNNIINKTTFTVTVQPGQVIDVLDEMDMVSLMEGDSVTLHSNLGNKQDNIMIWYFKDTHIAKFSGNLSKSCTDVKCNEGAEMFTDRLQLDQTGSLTITNLRTNDTGIYNLKLIKSSSTKFFSLTIVHGVPDSGKKFVSVGDSVTLNSNVNEIEERDVMTWYFKDTRIAEMNEDPSKSCTDVTCDEGAERFRDRLKIDHQTGDLTITNTRTTDSGLYQLEISSSISSRISNRHQRSISFNRIKSFSVNVTDSSLSPCAIAGICVGVVVLTVAVTAAGVIYSRQRKSGQAGQKGERGAESLDLRSEGLLSSDHQTSSVYPL